MTHALLARMTGRDPDEPVRSATPLELLFDLVFVVAVILLAMVTPAAMAIAAAAMAVLVAVLVRRLGRAEPHRAA